MARIWWLIAIVGSLALFATQNWSPSLSLTFLGRQSQALPLAVWISMSFMAGALTHLMVSWLFQRVDRQTQQFYSSAEDFDEQVTDDRPYPPDASSNKPSGEPEDWETSERSSSERVDSRSTGSDKTRGTSRSSRDDYFDDEEEEEDEFWDDREVDRPSSTFSDPKDSDLSDQNRESPVGNAESSYERHRPPKTSTQKGSVYSYSYRESARSGAGRSESVYDAEFRVLIPPPTQETVETAEDWEANEANDFQDSRSATNDDQAVWEEEEEEDWDFEEEDRRGDNAWQEGDRRDRDDWEFEDDRRR